MHRLWIILAFLFVAVAGLPAAEKFTFKLKDGSTLEGEIGKFSFKRDGVMVRLPGGSFSPTVKWDQISPESIQALADNKDALPFIAPMLAPSEEVKIQEEEAAKVEARTITIKPTANLLERPVPPSKLVALFVSPIGILLFLMIWGANIYAGYEIAIFKNRPAALVCSIAAVLPVLGSVLFFCLPAVHVKSQEELDAEAAAAAAALPEGEGQEPVVEEAAPVVVEEVPTGPQYPPTQVFKRGQFIFNRRFIETKFAAYFKPVLGEAEKDMVIIIKSARGEYTGHRFSKADQNEIYLQIFKGNVSEEVMLPLVEIQEIIVKHKEAPMP